MVCLCDNWMQRKYCLLFVPDQRHVSQCPIRFFVEKQIADQYSWFRSCDIITSLKVTHLNTVIGWSVVENLPDAN